MLRVTDDPGGGLLCLSSLILKMQGSVQLATDCRTEVEETSRLIAGARTRKKKKKKKRSRKVAYFIVFCLCPFSTSFFFCCVVSILPSLSIFASLSSLSCFSLLVSSSFFCILFFFGSLLHLFRLLRLLSFSPF